MTRTIIRTFFPLAAFLASCSPSLAGDTPAKTETKGVFAVTPLATLDAPWAIAVLPHGGVLVTEKAGKLKLINDTIKDVSGVPAVDFGGQGGLGDVVLAPDYAKSGTIYLSWVEAGENDTRGAAIGRAKLVLGDAPRLEGLEVIWRQNPKVTGRGHFSHRIAFSPDGTLMFVASGERQKFDPAQDLSVNLGKVLRLLPDGKPAPGNPFADKGGVSAEIWSYGHRNILGLGFDPQGRLWDLEHGPAGGDELNLVEPGKNYGWPLVSEGDHYDGRDIPPHSSRPEMAAPNISWTPVIAPGDMVFYRGKAFRDWRGQLLIAGLGSKGLVRVSIEGTKVTEAACYPLDKRIRDVAEARDGSLLVIEDGKDGRLLRLTPAK
ncbi:MAG: PQQ-dependent sugar dehydrogenase [Novosphingobium sp.]